jgi:hypothetical protein
MPRDYDNSDDRPPDLEDFLTRLVQKADQPGGAQASGPDWPPPGDEPPSLGGRLVKFVAAIVLVVLAALGIKLGTAGNGGSRSPEPISTEAMYAQREILVRSAPSGDSAVVRTLSRGERILVVERAIRGWVRVTEPDGHPIGYAYESDGNLGRKPPVDTRPASPQREPQHQGLISAPADTTAICKDGSVSFSEHASGTCAGHKGVGQWVHRPKS